MFHSLLKSALHSEAEVIIYLHGNGCESFKGRVLELNDEFFTLFHSGTGGGMLWAFPISQLAGCGLVLELPGALKDFQCPSEPECIEHPVSEQKSADNQPSAEGE